MTVLAPPNCSFGGLSSRMERSIVIVRPGGFLVERGFICVGHILRFTCKGLEFEIELSEVIVNFVLARGG
jgi:hypothetical protein